MAGDPKQLGAVANSELAAKLGETISRMENLMEKAVYRRHSTTGIYNSRFITQLTKNYRTHADILEFANELFYDNTLESCAPLGKCRTKNACIQSFLKNEIPHVQYISYFYKKKVFDDM